jgi:hypothetical protein
MLIDFVQKRSMGYVLQVWSFHLSLLKFVKKILFKFNHFSYY